MIFHVIYVFHVSWEITKMEVGNEMEIFITLNKYNTHQQHEEGTHRLWSLLSKNILLTIVSNVFMRNGTYPLTFTGRVYNTSHRTIKVAFWFGWNAHSCSFYRNGDKVFIFIVWSMSFKCPLKSIKLVSYCYCTKISHFTIGECEPVI